MINYNDFAFATVPRTGTRYALQVFASAGLGTPTVAQVHEPFPSGYKGYTASLVRHPYDWLVSYYFSINGGHVGAGPIDLVLPEIYRRVDNVYEFIRLVYLDHAGLIGNIFKRYAADTVLRLEDMPWAMLEFVHTLTGKEDHGTNTAARFVQNANKQARAHIIDVTIRKQLVKAEAEFCEWYDYC